MKIKAQGSKAEILLYDDIGEGFFGGITAKSFADELNAVGDVSEINLRINSPGGSVFDGFAIYNTLKRHKARVTVDIDGMALSIASVIAMAGDDIRMAENAQMMIHNPFTIVAGTSKEMRDTADVLDSLKEGILLTYENHSNIGTEALSEAMDNETWYNASEAVEAGLAHSVTEELPIAAHFDLSKFNNVSEAAAARARAEFEDIDPIYAVNPVEEPIEKPEVFSLDKLSARLEWLSGIETNISLQQKKAKLI